MSFWGGNFAKAEGKYNDSKCTESGSHWEVFSVEEGLATVIVTFGHECHHPNGAITYPPSNDIGYVYEVSIEANDPDEARDEIESLLEDGYGVGQLVDVLNSL